ncbi:MAG: hypothetical protein OXD32_03965, partial [Endozoicomonadaceae bacterium]|nr:hypothetical protein [Endozoicomonadaceae bacterium]
MLSCNYQRLSFWKVLSYTYKRLNHFAVALCLLFVTAPVFAALSAEDYDSDQFRAFIDTIRNPGHMGQLFLGTNIQKKVFQGKDKNTLVSKLIAAGVVNKSQLTAINGGMISNPSIPERMLNLLTESANVRGFHSKLMELLHEDHQFGLQGIALQIDNLYQTYLTNAQSQDTSTDHNDSNHVHIVPPTDLHSGNPPAYTDELMQVDPRDQAPPLVNKRPFMEQQQYPEPTYLPRTTTTTDTTSRTFLPPTAPPVGYMSPPAGYIPPAGGYMSPGRYPQQGGHIPPQTPGIPTNQVVVTVQPPVPTSTTALPSVNPTVIPTTVDHPTPAPRNTRPTNTATPADTTIAMAGILGSVTAQIKQQQQQQESINAQLQSSKQLGINDLEAIAISLGTSRTMDNMFAGMQNQTFDSIAKFVAEAVLSAAGNDWQKFTMPIINFMQSTVKKAPFITQIFNPLSEIEKGKMILKLYQLLILSELPCGSITQQIREQIVAISPNCDLSVLTSGISAQIKPAALFSNYNFIIYNYLVSENTSFNQLTINDPMALLQRLSEKSGVILQSGRANISNLSTFIL